LAGPASDAGTASDISGDEKQASEPAAKGKKRRPGISVPRPRAHDYNALRQAYDDQTLIPPVMRLLDDAARHGILDPSALAVTFTGRIAARRVDTAGTASVLVHWVPEGLCVVGSSRADGELDARAAHGVH